MKKILKLNSAFTILFAVIVSSLILALGLGIVAITMKEVRLSGAGKDSQLAFYAADSGLECAMYYDIVKSGFATSSESTGMPTRIECNGNLLEVDSSLQDLTSATSTFTMYMEYINIGVANELKPCAEDVAVIKYLDGGQAKTKIDSRGYNTCDETNPRRLERGYSVEYDNN